MSSRGLRGWGLFRPSSVNSPALNTPTIWICSAVLDQVRCGEFELWLGLSPARLAPFLLVGCMMQVMLHQLTCVKQVSLDTLGFMLKRAYEGQVCSIARALELVGDRWTLLVIRDVGRGRHRFDELLENLGIASNVLTDRLNRLVDAGVLHRVRYSERPERFEYHLTEKGLELAVALLALMHWGDHHLSDRPPAIARRRGDRLPVSVRIVAKDGSAVAPDELEIVPGPGLKPPRTSRHRSISTRPRSARAARA